MSIRLVFVVQPVCQLYLLFSQHVHFSKSLLQERLHVIATPSPREISDFQIYVILPTIIVYFSTWS